MRKNKFVPLVLLSLFFTCLQSKAQLTTNTDILRKASVETSLQEKENFRRLMILARQKGWSLTITNKKGQRAILVGVDVKGYPLYTGVNDNIISAATIKTNTLWPGGSSGLNLNGSSSNMKGKIAVWDEARPRATHVELANRPLQKDNPTSTSDHTTHVSGTLIAAGINPAAKGMAFGAQQLIAYDFNNHLSEMLAESPNLLVSNHSYGSIAGWNYNTDQNRWEFWGNSGDTADYKFGYYSTEAQVWDSIAYNAPYYLIVKSSGNNRDVNGPAVGQPYWRFNASGIMSNAGNRPAGISNNDGYDIIPTYGTAKNILTVGAVYPIPSGYTQPSDVVLGEFSSWGPTDDGRIKPDVVADGVNVLSCIATTDNSYGVLSGTSMASPATGGSSFLLQEYYSKLHGGAFMRSATLKGIIIHTADQAGPNPGPNYQSGWGLVDMQKAASVITSNNTDQLIYENNLLNGGSFTLPVIASGKGDLVATISWTDPKGSVDNINLLNNPAKKLINDLDLRVTTGVSTTYTPWVLDRLHPGNAATHGDDTLNNIEKVDIPNVIPGQTYTIKVTHKGSLDRGQQAYSLLVSGVGGQAYCASGPTSSAGTRIDSVSINNLQNANPAGCTTYTNYTNLTAQIQSSQTVAFNIKLSSCDASSASKIVKIFIDYNNNGNFTDPGENVAVSGVINGNGNFTGTFTTPAGLKVGTFTLMRVVAEETTVAANVTPCGTYGNGETQDYRVQIVSPSNDVGVTQLVDPSGAICATDSQRVTIRIRNFGTNTQLNVPISTIIQKGATSIATINTICPDTIPGSSEVIYTFQFPFPAITGNSYTIISRTILANDQDTTNDVNSTTIDVSSGNNTATGEAEICSTNPASVSLAANPVDSNDVAVWFDSPSSTTPIAAGNKTSTTEIPSNKTYYLALNDIKPNVGPPNKMVFPSGGYNAFSGNFVKFNNTVPVTIQSARLYIGHGGRINFTVAQIVNFNPDGSYSYYPISSNTINVYPTTPNPQAGAVTGNNASDTGAVFFLNLPVPTTGDQAIIIDCQDGATIFRNNSITGNPYPFSIPGVFAITGNSAINTSNSSDTTFYHAYYYFFYDMQIQLTNCPGPRVPVVATTATPPVITLEGKILKSNIAQGNQWYLNDTAIAGATGQTDTVNAPGVYKDVVTDNAGCELSSNEITYTAGGDIGLFVAPNPNNGQFLVQFFLSSTNNVALSILNEVGQNIYNQSYPNFSGAFSKEIDLVNISGGVYFVRVQVGNKNYVKKIVIRHY